DEGESGDPEPGIRAAVRTRRHARLRRGRSLRGDGRGRPGPRRALGRRFGGGDGGSRGGFGPTSAGGALDRAADRRDLRRGDPRPERRDGRAGERSGMNIQAMLKKAQALQAKMTQVQEELKAKEVIGSAGGGKVKVTMNGAQEVTAIAIDPEV